MIRVSQRQKKGFRVKGEGLASYSNRRGKGERAQDQGSAGWEGASKQGGVGGGGGLSEDVYDGG